MQHDSDELIDDRLRMNISRAVLYSPVQPPPVLRAFDDDWEAFRTRNEQSRDPWELENTPLAKDSPPLSLPVTANPAVLDHADRCDVVLARRVGAGEVVREVHLLPVAPR